MGPSTWRGCGSFDGSLEQHVPLGEQRRRLEGLSLADVRSLLGDEERHDRALERAEVARSPRDYVAGLLRGRRPTGSHRTTRRRPVSEPHPLFGRDNPLRRLPRPAPKAYQWRKTGTGGSSHPGSSSMPGRTRPRPITDSSSDCSRLPAKRPVAILVRTRRSLLEVQHMATETNGAPTNASGQPDLSLEMRPERRLIRPHGSLRHVDFRIHVAPGARPAQRDRSPLAISLVLDRSGSMHGQKIVTARQAAIAVLDQLRRS